MARWFLRISTIIALSIIAASLNLSFSTDYFNIMFNVIGIMFSVALSQVLSFSFSSVTNEDFVVQHRAQLVMIQNTFIVLFFFATVFFSLSSKHIEVLRIKKFVFSVNCFFGVFDLFCLLYFSINFLGLFKLKNEMDDLIRKAL